MAPNQLIKEKSPYLLQHAHNPVDWHAWSDEAFAKAHQQNKPIFLSIGYATCHWCHVMEKETFEDAEAARYLNDTFVCIKVDREERPDVDAVYMAACQMITGSGGWPLTIFMTPDKRPFFAATYLPRRTRFGRAGVIELCEQIKTLWQNQPERVFESADGIASHLNRAFEYTGGDEPDNRTLDQAYDQIAQGFDPEYGGFDSAPKFPTPHRLLFLLRCYHRTDNPQALKMVEETLTAMRLGGIWDHVGFGFHRYATDRNWLLPHFEKMLYDQALLALAYLETFQITRNDFYAETARLIFDYVLRDMTDAEGGFYTAEDADSEGEEGKFYVWTTAEFKRILGKDKARTWADIFNITDEGNFLDESTRQKTGANILHLQQSPGQLAENSGWPVRRFAEEWATVRRDLFEDRERRVHPLKDDKILTDWNGLMIAALARAGRVLGDKAYTTAARKAAGFVLDRLRGPNGRLRHRFREGETAIDGQAEDYAFLIFGLLELFQAGFDPHNLEVALNLQDRMITDFWDAAAGGFFSTASDSDDLPVRPKDLYDGALPSANAVAFLNLLTLSKLTGDARWEEKAQAQIRAFSGTIQKHPPGFTFFLVGLDFALNPGQEVVITGKSKAQDTLELLELLNINFSPNKVTLFKSEENADQLTRIAGYTDGLQVAQGKATAHLCKGFACQEATSDPEAMIAQLFGKKQ